MAVVHVRVYRRGSWATFSRRSVSGRGNCFGQADRQSTVCLQSSAALRPSHKLCGTSLNRARIPHLHVWQAFTVQQPE